MPTPRKTPRSARSAPAARAKGSTAKSKTKAKAKAKAAPKAAPKTAPKAKAKPTQPSPATKASPKTIGSEVDRLKKASEKVEARLKAVSAEVAKKLAAFEDLAEQQLKTEKNKARLAKLEKDVDRLISSADQQFTKVRGALDDELKDLKEMLDKSTEKVIPAAKERIASLLADKKPSNDTWEFYTDKSGKWRWRLVDGNGKSVGASNKAFKSRPECAENARRLGYKGG